VLHTGNAHIAVEAAVQRDRKQPTGSDRDRSRPGRFDGDCYNFNCSEFARACGRPATKFCPCKSGRCRMPFRETGFRAGRRSTLTNPIAALQRQRVPQGLPPPSCRSCSAHKKKAAGRGLSLAGWSSRGPRPRGGGVGGQTPKGTFRKHHLRVRPVLCFNRVSSSSGNGFVGSETLDCGEGATLLVPQPQPQAVAFAALTVPASSVGQSAPRRLSRPG
jgi:hypothetical protein